MSAFEQAFKEMVSTDEGGFVLHTVADDTGGKTFAGISYNNWKDWEGWPLVDAGKFSDPQLTQMVREFYRKNFWQPMNGDILPPRHAENIFRWGVNAGLDPAVKLAQAVVGVIPDGAVGPKTAAAMEAMPYELFEPPYFKAKTNYYRMICNRKRSQTKFLLGWLNRIARDSA